MALLKCLEGFKAASNNLYSEDEMRQISIDILKERGVEVKDIAMVAFWAQSKYLPGLKMEEMEESVLEVLGKRDQFHSILLAASIDAAAENKIFDEPLSSILNDDLGLFGIDEAIAIQVSGNYGTIGVTNFGNMDVNKPGIISVLQNNKKKCNCFLDDIVGALAAVSAIRVAQKHAITESLDLHF